MEFGEGGVPCANQGDCPNFVGPYDESVLCLSCQDGQAPVADDAVPVAIDDVPTKRIRTPSDQELADELAQHADAGQGGDL